ncbi:hypothetical protein LCGC14_0948490 [marine sediment metagenome]|uniref:Uncharacterized protein n=1 Tax=marine sediment metagenome TaxID=412755 RepID=A0A0F9RPE1_9ZZZZ
MEKIILEGTEWAVDENCIVHAAGNQFQISVKTDLARKLNLSPRDIIKIYAKKVGHKEQEPREIKNNFKKEEI